MLLLFLLALIAAWIAYDRCGGGFGLGPGGTGSGDGPGDEGHARVDRGAEPASPAREKAGESPAGEERAPEIRPAVGNARPRRCKLRLDANGLTLDESPTTIESAVAACKQSGGAELTVTGDAVFGERERIREALERAGVEAFVREPGTTHEK